MLHLGTPRVIQRPVRCLWLASEVQNCSRTAKAEILRVFNGEPQGESDIEHAMSACAARSFTGEGEFRAITWDIVKTASAIDDISVAVNHYIATGFLANRSDMPDELKTFWHLQTELYSAEGVPM